MVIGFRRRVLEGAICLGISLDMRQARQLVLGKEPYPALLELKKKNGGLRNGPLPQECSER
jgi:hypothetical protein